MKISKGRVEYINKKLLAGTLALTFLATKLVGYTVIKHTKYSSIKSGYIQTDDSSKSLDLIESNITDTENYAVLPELDTLDCYDLSMEPNKAKDNYKNNQGNDGFAAYDKRKIFKKSFNKSIKKVI